MAGLSACWLWELAKIAVVFASFKYYVPAYNSISDDMLYPLQYVALMPNLFQSRGDIQVFTPV